LVAGVQVLVGQHAQRGPGRAVAQVRVASAAYQLKYLGQELNLAYAAASQLDVVAALGMAHFLPFYLGADLAMHDAHRVDGAEIEIAPIDEGPDDVVQFGNV